MVKTITQIDGCKVIAALQSAKPVTATGKIAVANFKKFMSQNCLTATGLDNALHAFESMRADVGLIPVVGMLRGLMPEANRKVACAYECIANEDKQLLYAAGTEAENKVAELYKYNAGQIIDKLVSGELDMYATNPAIAQLIKYAKDARLDLARSRQDLVVPVGSDVTVKLVPVLNITALASDNALVYIDGRLCILNQRGSLSLADDFDEVELDQSVRKLLSMLQCLQVTSEPAVLSLSDALRAEASKILGEHTIKFDLLADNTAFVQINDNAMSADKAIAVLSADNPNMLAATILDPKAKSALDLIVNLIAVLNDYRGVLLTNLYARAFHAGESVTMYVLHSDNYYNVLVTSYTSTAYVKAYNSIMDVLADDFVATNVALFNAIQCAYAEDINNATKKMHVRVKLVNDISEDITKLQNLYDRITAELGNLDDLPDANPAKRTALLELQQKTSAKLEEAKQELSKLTD